jgi:magnesium chelatase family protein
MTALAREQGYTRVFVPAEDTQEAALLPDVEVIPVTGLGDLVGHLTGLQPIAPLTVDWKETFSQDPVYAADFADIMGLGHLKSLVGTFHQKSPKPQIIPTWLQI